MMLVVIRTVSRDANLPPYGLQGLLVVHHYFTAETVVRKLDPFMLRGLHLKMKQRSITTGQYSIIRLAKGRRCLLSTSQK